MTGRSVAICQSERNRSLSSRHLHEERPSPVVIVKASRPGIAADNRFEGCFEQVPVWWFQS
jgi:hypothetical protein